MGLRIKVILSSLTATVIAVLLIASIALAQQKSLIESEQVRAVTALAKGIARSCELPIAVGDHTQLDRLIAGLSVDPQIAFVAIFDAEGELLAHDQSSPQLWETYRSGRLKSGTAIMGTAAVPALSAGSSC
ncbi:MAG: hypothetical protein AAF488_01315 [Planctomycetota bacterium]